MTKFEYKFELNLGVDDDGVVDNVEEELDKLGAEGWELIAVSPCGKDNSYTGSRVLSHGSLLPHTCTPGTQARRRSRWFDAYSDL